MSGPLTGDQVPAEVREFREKLRAFNLAAAKWLGLDPSKVFRLELVEHIHELYPELYSMAKWESTEDLTASVGVPGQTGVVDRHVGYDDERFLTYHQATYFDYDQGRALWAEVGPVPSMFTPGEEQRLRAGFGSHLNID
jgi:hypothetical protein